MTQIQHKGTGPGSLAITLFSLLLLTAQLTAKPLKVFILAGQSNMEGPAQVATFDYLGDDPATAPFWSDELAAIAAKHEQIHDMAYRLSWI